MDQISPLTQTSKGMLWSGRIITALVALFMLFDASIHFSEIPAVTQSIMQMGYSLSIIRPLSVIEFISIVLYIIPQTSVLGAILLTGYLGGAVDANVRASNPLFSFTLTPVYIGILLWLGLWLRSGKLRGLIPLKK
jgi:DoxX-like family